MGYGTVLEHIIAAWEHQAPEEFKGRLAEKLAEARREGLTLRQMQVYAAGALYDGLKSRVWEG